MKTKTPDPKSITLQGIGLFCSTLASDYSSKSDHLLHCHLKSGERKDNRFLNGHSLKAGPLDHSFCLSFPLANLCLTGTSTARLNFPVTRFKLVILCARFNLWAIEGRQLEILAL